MTSCADDKASVEATVTSFLRISARIADHPRRAEEVVRPIVQMPVGPEVGALIIRQLYSRLEASGAVSRSVR
jgi:hypothetical protein